MKILRLKDLNWKCDCPEEVKIRTFNNQVKLETLQK